MAETRRCPHCGTELAADAPEGLCPKCLLVHGLATQPPSDSQAAADSRSAPSQSYSGPFTAPTPEVLAKHFPQLEIIELLGQGGMGAVYKARQPRLDRLVAVKILPPDAARDPAFAERFEREARALAKINHPNIVAVYDSGQHEGLFYFIMEYVDGVNLRELIRSGQCKPEEALRIVPLICEALQFAHDEGIVHRDIKPENILLDKRGRLKIADFGLARLLGQTRADYTLTGPWQVMGTPNYMAPEQMDDPLKVDHRADIYALGVVFYEMLTGDLPRGRFAPPSQKVQVDVRLDEVVLRALEQEPQRRYQQASEVKTDVESISRSPQPPRGVGDASTLSPISLCVQATATGRVVDYFQLKKGLLRDASRLRRFFFTTTLPDVVTDVLDICRLFDSDCRIITLIPNSATSAALDLSIIGKDFSITCARRLVRGSFPFNPFAAEFGGNYDVIVTIPANNRAFRERLVGQLQGKYSCRMIGSSTMPEPSRPKLDHVEAARPQPVLQSHAGAGDSPTRPTPPASDIVQAPADAMMLVGGAALVTAIGVAIWLLAKWNDVILKPNTRFGLTFMSVVHSVYALFMIANGWLMRRLRFRIAVLLGVVLVGLFVPAVLAVNVIMELPRIPEWPVGIPIWLGMPVALWATILLFRRDVRGAFVAATLARHRPSMPAEGSPTRTRRFSVSKLQRALITLILGLLAFALVIPLVMQWRFGRVPGRDVTAERFRFDADGPVVGDEIVQTLDLKPIQVTEVNKLIQAAYRDYLPLETEHTRVEKDDAGRVHVTIAPFDEGLDAIEQRLWAGLDGLLDERQRTVARRHLPVVALLRHGRGEATVDIWKEKGTWHYKEFDKGRMNGSSGFGKLPKKYDRYMREANERARDSSD